MSGGGHLRSNTKEFQLLGQPPGGPNSNAFKLTHAEWGEKKSSLEACTHLKGYHLIDIGKMWWEGSYDLRVEMEGCRLFRKDRLGRQGKDISDQLECIGMDEELTENLGIRDRWCYTGGLLQVIQTGKLSR